MFRVCRLLGLFVGAIVLLGAFAAEARRGSVLINKRPIRAKMNKLVRGGEDLAPRRLSGTPAHAEGISGRQCGVWPVIRWICI